jgi:hypothetical protein
MSALADTETLTWLRRLLDRRVSVGGLTEVAVWLAVGYLAIGLTWSLFHPDGVLRIQEQLEQQLQLPAGTNYELAALGEASILWPVASVLPSLGCAH